jgi:hypothetical protein
MHLRLSMRVRCAFARGIMALRFEVVSRRLTRIVLSAIILASAASGPTQGIKQVDRSRLADRTAALLEPFRRLRPNLGQSITPGTVFVPGDVAPLQLPSGFDAAKVTARVARSIGGIQYEWAARTRILWSKRASAGGLADLNRDAVARVAAEIPQLAYGSYDLYYVDGDNVGPKVSIVISPTLSLQGPRSGAVGSSFQVRVQVVGPQEAPTLLKPRVTRDNSFAPEGLARNRLDRSIRVKTVSDPAVIGVTPGVGGSAPFDADGLATLAVEIKTIGSSDLVVSAPGFRDAGASITGTVRPVPVIFDDPNRPFNVVVLGDSVLWGQGLKTEHKMFSLVNDWMKPTLGSKKSAITVLAHSGASIDPVDDPSGRNDEDDPLPGEMPNAFPTIGRQAGAGAERFATGTVDLVIMNGGANDFTLLDVLNPIGTDVVGAIRNRAKEVGHDKLLSLLRSMSNAYAYRKSTILVAGYYPIVSTQSDLSFIAPLVGGLVLVLWPDASTKPLVSLAAALAAGFAAEELRNRLATQCATFASEINGQMQSAVSDANDELLEGQRRIHFVSPAFGAERAIFAPQHWVWNTGLDDEMASARQRIAGDYLAEAPPGLVASIGHPNLDGEQRYADKLTSTLDQNRAQWDPGRALRQFDATLAQPLSLKIVTKQFNRSLIDRGFTLRPVVVTDGDSGERQFTVTCRDKATGRPVDAYVFVGTELVGHTNKQLHYTFRYAKDSSGETDRPPIVISRQGYADIEVPYTWTVTSP